MLLIHESNVAYNKIQVLLPERSGALCTVVELCSAKMILRYLNCFGGCLEKIPRCFEISLRETLRCFEILCKALVTSKLLGSSTST
jgi:hypothetical protein